MNHGKCRTDKLVVRFVVKNKREHEKERMMGRHGENIRKRTDGRWEARCMVYDADKEKRILKSVYGHTYEEAKQKRLVLISGFQNQSVKADADKSRQQILQNILFRTVAEGWLETIRSRHKASTYEKYSMIYHRHLEETLGKMMIGDITESFVKQFSVSLSDSLQRSIYCVLNQILKYASAQYSAKIPCIQKPASNAGNKKIKVYTKTEQARILSTVWRQMDIFKMAVFLSLLTGLRLGELCALKWSDIDFEEKTLSIKRTVQRLRAKDGNKKTVLMETEPKSSGSSREIPLLDASINLLLSFQNGGEYIFGGDRPLDPRTMQNRYKRIIKEAGVAYKNFHTLRHTYATNCMDGGADAKALSEMLGHSNIQTTMNYYVHPSIDTKRRYVDGLYTLYAGIRGQICGRTG
ncbi:MAG: site-specific integrase [bacterium]|nr:site-specific integrase [bacterium]MCM1423627.1 site-specific integrase [bacterium]